eukprot:scaffold10417_cov83-Skeletonema_dohrnii-CCMP3373.AAC.1
MSIKTLPTFTLCQQLQLNQRSLLFRRLNGQSNREWEDVLVDCMLCASAAAKTSNFRNTMVTRTVILVTASEAAAFAATSTLSSSSSAVAADSVINNVPAEENNSEELQTNHLFNYPSYTKRAQHTSPGGLVQLCRQKGCLNAVDFEKRGGGLCCVHQKGPMDGEQSDSEDSEDVGKILPCSLSVRGSIKDVTGDERLSDTHSTHGNNYGLDEVGKKRDCPSEDSISGKDDNKRQKVDAFVLDLTGVPPQYPIPKSGGYIKEGASKYTGVSFHKRRNKWRAQIVIDGKHRHIGCYENEEEAAVDYARAVFKYRGQGHWDRSHDQLGGAALGGNKTKKRLKDDTFAIDLTDVPPQSPIPKSSGRVKEGASKYKGISFNKQTNKWHAQIMIAGKSRFIGSYEIEEEAAVDYARAVFKYKGQGALDKARETKEENSFAFDLSNVPPQPPIPKSGGYIKEGASKYNGVTFSKAMNKWQAQISIDGKQRLIGYYENEEEAAADYARAVFKYKGQGALDKAREQRARDTSRVDAFTFDLTDVPPHREQDSIIIDLTGILPQSPIPKIEGRIKEGASKYTGVSFNRETNKWQVNINIDGKKRHIGSYENEEEAGVDYARAVFKYKGQGALDKARERNSAIIDLTDVPPQPPIFKSDGRIKVGASKYTGVSFNKPSKNWHAQIFIDGKRRWIGSYENEEEAAADYARAVIKYKGQGALDKARETKEENYDGKIRAVAGDEYCLDDAFSDTHSIHGNTNYGLDEVGKKRVRPSEESISGKDDNKRQRVDAFIIDLTDVPPQPPIPKSAGCIKEGASKYKGVSFDNRRNKWQAKIYIDGKDQLIGYYDYENEEEAAADYARAVFKYRGQGALDKAREAKEENSFIIDLSDVPPQSPIPKSAGRIKDGASKYTGVFFNKPTKKWITRIDIEGKNRYIGSYENEEEAGSDYARAVFKYKGQGEPGKAREQDSFIIDLGDVPPQPPILKSSGSIKEGASKYIGVTFNKQTNKWQAQIRIEGKNRHIGYYDNEEEAAVDYARAVFKYKGQGHWDRSHDQLRGAAIGSNETKKRQKVGVIAFDLERERRARDLPG